MRGWPGKAPEKVTFEEGLEGSEKLALWMSEGEPSRRRKPHCRCPEVMFDEL